MGQDAGFIYIVTTYAKISLLTEAQQLFFSNIFGVSLTPKILPESNY